MVDPHITAAAADAAIIALCDETMCPREIFNADEDYASGQSGLNTLNGYSTRLFILNLWLVYPLEFAKLNYSCILHLL